MNNIQNNNMNINNNQDNDIIFFSKGKLAENPNVSIFMIINFIKMEIQKNGPQNQGNNKDLVNNITKALKDQLQGEWFVALTDENDNNFEFNLTDTHFKEITAFKYMKFIVYLYRII